MIVRMRAAGMAAFLVAGAFSSSGVASATTITLNLEEGVGGYSGTADTSIYQNRLSNAGGGFPHIFAGATMDSSPRRALLRFDLSAVPAGMIVQSAELRLSVDQSRPGVQPHSLQRVGVAWGEGSAFTTLEPGGFGAPAAPGDATWSSSAHGAAAWTVPGGDYAAAPSAIALVDIQGTTATFTGAGMTQDVHEWIAQPASNHGWILRGNEAGVHNARRFHSAEGQSGLRPRLTLTLDLPSGAAAEWSLYD